jgi:tetratricopeptide (TPR) repeat protein
MEHEHLDAAGLERILALDRTEDQNRNLLHQIAVCPECRAVGGWLLDLRSSGALTLLFGPIDVALARSRAEAPSLWQELEPLAPEEQLSVVSRDRRYTSWGLCELLCRESERTAAGNAARAMALANLAIHVADAVAEGEPYEERWVYQLRALAWVHLGNARRVGGILPSAEEAFVSGDSWWAAGTTDIEDALGYEPILWDLKASLRTDQRRLPEALKLLDQVVETYLYGAPEFRDPHLAGRALVKKAHALIEMAEPDQAVAALRKAEALVNPERDPRLLLCIRHNLVDNLSKSSCYAEADALLPAVRSLTESCGSRLDHLRLSWVEGRIAAGLGDWDRARRLLGEVRSTLLADGIASDAALVNLDLAIVALQEGKTDEVKTLAAEMVSVFQAQNISREALASLLVFQHAAELEKATVELAREVAASLARGREGAPA